VRIALMVGDFEDGGVERTLTQLASGLAGLGAAVDLLVGRTRHVYLDGLHAGAQIRPLSMPRDVALERYLSEIGPDVLMSGKLADDRLALAVRERLAGTPAGRVRLVTTVGTPLSARERAFRWNPLKRLRERRRIRAEYQRLDAITAVSQAVADDLRQLVPGVRVPLRVLCNPVVPDDLAVRASAPCPHPWLADAGPPVLMAIGGLRKVKDFASLLRAFARVVRGADARLLILGEGKERRRLEGLIARLGLEGRAELAGFVPDPFPWLARARLLVLSSRREGLGNVLVESLAVGTPVVATDCPGGVRALLDGGRLGRLVPVADPVALADAILATLAETADREALLRAAEPYRIPVAARAYLDLFEALVRGACEPGVA
jgi:glycosyltransferase involved in cell wall biosynthesis